MKLDRALQLEMLEKLAEEYPEQVDLQGMSQGIKLITQNAYYLHEHGLIDGEFAEFLGDPMEVISARITKDGLDFLAKDGGLSAILGVVTIKLHEEQLLQLLERRIESSAASPEDKIGLLSQLRALPGESIKHLTMKLLDLGMDRAPDALQLLRTALDGALK